MYVYVPFPTWIQMTVTHQISTLAKPRRSGMLNTLSALYNLFEVLMQTVHIFPDSMEDLPIKILGRVYTYVCTNGGSTGCALSVCSTSGSPPEHLASTPSLSPLVLPYKYQHSCGASPASAPRPSENTHSPSDIFVSHHALPHRRPQPRVALLHIAA